MPANLAIIVAVSIGAALLALSAFRWPTCALAVCVIMSVLLHEYVLFPNATSLRVQLSQLLLAGLLIGFGIRWVLRLAPTTAPGTPELVMLALMIWSIVSGCMSGAIFMEDGTRSISILLNGFAIPVLILYLVRSIPQSATTLRTASTVLTVFLGYLIVTAFGEHFQISWLVFPQYILDPSIGMHADRARGPVLNAAENGGIIAILMVVALHRIGYLFAPLLRWSATAALLITGLSALWFTQTRGVWVAFGGGLLVMLLHERRKRMAAALLTIAVVAIPVVILLQTLQIEVVPQRPETTEFRLDLYSESLTAFEEHPITGWGLGTFTTEDHLFGDNGHSRTFVGVQHDTTVAIATDTGAIGAILYILFLVILFRSLYRLRRSARKSEKRDFFAMCMAALTIFVINGTLVDNRYLMSQNAVVFLVVGLGLAIRPYERMTSRSVCEEDVVIRRRALAV
jgi:O-antigen ligase